MVKKLLKNNQKRKKLRLLEIFVTNKTGSQRIILTEKL